MKYDVTYFGFSLPFLENLTQSRHFDVKGVVVESARLTKKLQEYLQQNRIKFFIIDSREDLNLVDTFLETELVIIHKFGYIIPKEITQKYNMFNIHSGNLLTNRGAHPLNWSILLGEKETCLSLYKVDERIDLGLCISEYFVSISQTDNTITLAEKLEKGYPSLLINLYRYLEKEIKGTVISSGTYRAKMKRSDFTIDIVNDDSFTVSAKIRSQQAYKGAILHVQDQDYYVKDVQVTSVNRCEKSEMPKLLISTEYIEVVRGTERLIFEINK